jgi:hypothetical protein
VAASDGGIGHVEELYFDDEAWGIRYMVGKTGNWIDEQRSGSQPCGAVGRVAGDTRELAKRGGWVSCPGRRRRFGRVSRFIFRRRGQDHSPSCRRYAKLVAFKGSVAGNAVDLSDRLAGVQCFNATYTRRHQGQPGLRQQYSARPKGGIAAKTSLTKLITFCGTIRQRCIGGARLRADARKDVDVDWRRTVAQLLPREIDLDDQRRRLRADNRVGRNKDAPPVDYGYPTYGGGVDVWGTEVAKRFGATETIKNAHADAVKTVMIMTAGYGVDTAIEAVGIRAMFRLCEDLIAPGGGTIANIDVHRTEADPHPERLWERNITITTRLVDTLGTPMLLSSLHSKKNRRNHRLRTASVSTILSTLTRSFPTHRMRGRSR